MQCERIRRLSQTVPAPAGEPFPKRHFTIVARLIPKKNIATALDAYAMYAQEAETPRPLHICGSGPLEPELKAQAAALGVEQLLSFRGYLQTAEVCATLGDTLALILPSVEEQFGNVIIEAQAMGLPVIVSDNVGARDNLVRSGVNGFVVEPSNAAGFAFFMKLLSTDEKLWRRMSERAPIRCGTVSKCRCGTAGSRTASPTHGIPTMNLFAALALPPPVHGQSISNAAVVASLIAGTDHVSIVADIGPRVAHKGLEYHVTRLARVVWASSLLLHSCKTEPGQFYTVVESGLGIAYNFVLVGLARLTKRRIILHHHTSAHTLLNRPSFSILSRCAGRSAVHVALSNNMARDLLQYGAVHNVIVLHNAWLVDQRERRAVAKRSVRKAIVVGHLSNLSREKGLCDVIETVILARERGFDVRLVLGGPVTRLQDRNVLGRAQRTLGSALDYRGSIAAEQGELLPRRRSISISEQIPI